MKLNLKDYKIIKTKKYFQTNKLFFVVNGINRNSPDWLLIQQELKTICFNSYKILNKITLKALKNSMYNNTKSVIGGSTFLLKPNVNKYFSKQTTLNTFNLLSFDLLIVKLNNKTYSVTSLKTAQSMEYKETKLFFHQFNLTHVKTCFIISK
jgi:cellobiose-specific phosphotransferase system component IIC